MACCWTLVVWKLEILCVCQGGCERRCVAGRWKVVSKFGDGFLWCCGGMCGMICVSYKIWPVIWFLFCFNVRSVFSKIFIKTVYRVSEVFG